MTKKKTYWHEYLDRRRHVCNVRKGSGSLRQCKIYPNKDHLGSKDSKKPLGSSTVDLAQCLGFPKFGRQAKVDSIIESEYNSGAFVLTNETRRMPESTQVKCSSG